MAKIVTPQDGLCRFKPLKVNPKGLDIRISMFAIASDAPVIYAIVTERVAKQIRDIDVKDRGPFGEVLSAPPEWRPMFELNGLVALVVIKADVVIQEQQLDDVKFLHPVNLPGRLVFYERDNNKRLGNVQAIEASLKILDTDKKALTQANSVFVIRNIGDFPFGEEGDGGRLVYLEEHPLTALGVLIASNGTSAIVSPLHSILGAFNIEILTDKYIRKRNASLRKIRKIASKADPLDIDGLVSSDHFVAASGTIEENVISVKKAVPKVRASVSKVLGIKGEGLTT